MLLREEMEALSKVEELVFTPKQQETITFPFQNVTLEVNEGTPGSGKTTADILKWLIYTLFQKTRTI